MYTEYFPIIHCKHPPAGKYCDPLISYPEKRNKHNYKTKYMH